MNWGSLKRTAAELRKHVERFEEGMALKTVCIGVHTCCQDGYCCQGNLAEGQACELFAGQSNTIFEIFKSTISSLIGKSREYGIIYLYYE